MLETLKQIGKDALEELRDVSNLTQLEQFRIKYLSRKGKLTQMLSQVGQLSPELRPQAGQLEELGLEEVIAELDELRQKETNLLVGA